MDSTKTFDFVSQVYDDSIIPTLVDYIKIPNQSPAYDPEWATNGLMDKALDLMVAWVRAQNVQGLTLEVLREAGRTPLVFMEIPGTVQNKDLTVLLYGHMDKQPPFEGWSEGLGPYKPVIKDGKLYGRGGADDGYAIFSSVLAIKACREQNIPHARCVVLIEACEESGSLDLEHYVGLLAPRIGTPSLIVCLDSGAGNYEQMWMTTSLRGIVAGNLRVQILNEGVHSGDASGIVPSSFRIARQLISRLENENTGEIIPRDFYVDIPKQRVEQAQVVADILKDEVWDKYPYVAGAGPVHKNRAELVLNRTWRPALSTVGAHGFPPLQIAGNVSALRRRSSCRCAFPRASTPPRPRRHSASSSRPTRPTARVLSLRLRRRRPVGMRPRLPIGWRRPRTMRARPSSTSPPATWERAAPFPLWACSAPSSPRPSLSSLAFSAR
eukprot:Opistho-1_new@60266